MHPEAFDQAYHLINAAHLWKRFFCRQPKTFRDFLSVQLSCSPVFSSLEMSCYCQASLYPRRKNASSLHFCPLKKSASICLPSLFFLCLSLSIQKLSKSPPGKKKSCFFLTLCQSDQWELGNSMTNFSLWSLSFTLKLGTNSAVFSL